MRKIYLLATKSQTNTNGIYLIYINQIAISKKILKKLHKWLITSFLTKGKSQNQLKIYLLRLMIILEFGNHFRV
ncbi:hypothetical protein SDC9_102039 [bioreactor metagenome]|uniref:Uncharacterized protein n=1 Tax=bioreactor metagenome TaxID=1076179 RepID=A0A645AQR3_9ZZZZ